MSRRYNTDGMLVYPDDGTGPKLNALESIECAIAFDVHDWASSRRHAWIYAIVFGWDDEAWSEFRECYGWDEEDRKRANHYHSQWEALKETLKEHEDRDEVSDAEEADTKECHDVREEEDPAGV